MIIDVTKKQAFDPKTVDRRKKTYSKQFKTWKYPVQSLKSMDLRLFESTKYSRSRRKNYIFHDF